MSGKARVALAVLAAMVLVGSWMLGRRTVIPPPPEPQRGTPPAEVASAPSVRSSEPPQPTATLIPGPPSAPDPSRPPISNPPAPAPSAPLATATPEPAARTVEMELHAMRAVFRDYREAFQFGWP